MAGTPGRVSVVMLACDKARYTRLALDGLLLSTWPDLELVFLDNGSRDETPAVLADFAAAVEARGWRVVALREAENIGAVAGRNRCLERVTGDTVVFLDNDVVIGRRSWLERLRAVLERDGRIGILGPKILYAEPPRPIQAAGCIVCKGGRVLFRGRGAAADDPAYAEPAEVQALISACWIMPRAVVDELGPLDRRFDPVQFEDIDYCYRARAAGYLCRYEPSVEVYHFENVTTGGTASIRYKHLTIKNGLKFKRKWREMIAAESGPDDASVPWVEFPRVPFEALEPLPLRD